MSEWKKVKLGEICKRVTSGGTPKSNVSSYYGGDIPWLNTKEVDFCRLYTTETKITQEGYNNSSTKWIEKNSVIVAMYGNTAGKVALSKIPLTTNQACCNLTIDNSIADYEYVYYYLMGAYQQLANMANGAAQKNLNAQVIKSFEINLPIISTQHHIATILSRYDSLIENYQKQIKLLEEAAQRLYKEWFVDLHFPGHENTKIVDGVPEGWEKKRLEEIAELKAGGDKPEIVSGIRTNDCSVPIFSNGTTNEGLYGYTKFPVIVKQSVTISARGSVGYTVLRRTPFVPIVRLISVIPHNVYVGYVFFYLKSTTLDSNGAAQQQITIPMIRNKGITIPSKGILEIFESQTEPIFNQIDILKEQIRLLTEARDRLLPKLMSGEIAV